MFNSILGTSLTISGVLICSIVSIILGLAISFVHSKTANYTKDFLITLVILPLLVEVVMMMVNGNLGTSVAILGAFSLIRFRSMPGTSRELASIFLAMAIGLATGMGQIYFAMLITFLALVVLFICSKSSFGERNLKVKKLRIVIPEDLDYEEVFNDILKKYTNNYSLDKIKTINMGSMFELSYTVDLKANEKDFINELRERNGNMKIVLSHPLEVDAS